MSSPFPLCLQAPKFQHQPKPHCAMDSGPSPAQYLCSTSSHAWLPLTGMDHPSVSEGVLPGCRLIYVYFYFRHCGSRNSKEDHWQPKLEPFPLHMCVFPSVWPKNFSPLSRRWLQAGKGSASLAALFRLEQDLPNWLHWLLAALSPQIPVKSQDNRKTKRESLISAGCKS